ncbi:MAG: aminotransferase class I/II-fold pyridoxal phosphate-dependent enzyme [Myxococcales bacterium FL481]|nr:MAG: aminotransferase class I/II-fold pyridoxal phosphate-dependent enzyme [Myxococcales bacterium FL481]
MANHLVSRLQAFGTTIFAEMTALAREHDAVNLGQGFPDFDGPDFVKQAAIAAIERGDNQYCPPSGVPPLNAAIAEHQARFYGLHYDADHEVTVYSGATEAIFATLSALCEPGDEVVVFEPFYDSYRANLAMVGARERLVTLHSPGFEYDPRALEAAFGPKTRAVLLNTPHNPTGKVFSRAELEHIADLCRRHDVLAITDEVYEHLVFDGEHICLATLPGMRERTVVISSLGKTFSLTGWKIGHTCAPPSITRALRCAHQFMTYCTATPLQHAAAAAYRAPDQYFEQLRTDYAARRDHLCSGLAQLGFEVLVPAGTYFALTDIRPLGFDDDMTFCRELPGRVGVAAIPPSAFYVNPAHGRHLVRWAFCKSRPVIDEGLRRLARLHP